NTCLASEDPSGVLGIHFEGPFLTSSRAGVHDKAHIRAANDADLAIVRSVRNGITVLTVAPEAVSSETIRLLASEGIRVSLGHTDATFEQGHTALASGASCVTHIYNAMSPLTSRVPGIVGCALDEQGCWGSIIVDGFHCHFAAARIAVRAKKRGKTI